MTSFYVDLAALQQLASNLELIEKEISAAQTAHSTATQQQASYTPPDTGASGTSSQEPLRRCGVGRGVEAVGRDRQVA